MANNHLSKYTSKMLLGITLVTCGIFLAIYTAINPSLHGDWYFWALAVAAIVNAGLLFLCRAFVHKIKADLIRKQKHQEQHKTFTAD